MSDVGLSGEDLTRFNPPQSTYYRRDGTPMTAEEMHADMANIWSEASRRVGYDEVMFRGVKYDVSTVHLVINHSFGSGPPLIFETMIFVQGSAHDEYMQRYSTEAEALAGHNFIVDTLRRGGLPEIHHQALER